MCTVDDCVFRVWDKCEADLLLFEGGEEAHGAGHQLWPCILQLWRRALLRQCHQGDETQQIHLLVIHAPKVLRAATWLAGKDHLQHPQLICCFG